METKTNPSPFSLRQPSSSVKVTELTDPTNAPGASWSITLRKSYAVGFHKASSMLAVLVQRYFDGFDGRPPLAFPAVGGEPVDISENLFDQVSQVWASQPGAVVPEPADLDSIHTGPEVWSCEELIAIAAVAPEAWIQLMNEWTAVQKAPKGSSGNAPAGLGETSSESPSNTPGNTLN